MFALLACAEPPAEEAAFIDPRADGPHGVGVTTLAYTDSRGKPLTIEAWYPATVEGDPDPYEPFVFTGLAHRDALVIEGQWPLVAFSHGYSGFRMQSFFLTEWLASHGFVVVAPDHTYNTFFDLDDDLTSLVMLERPGDIAGSVDAALEHFDVEDRYVMMGHSFGGWTTLAVAGGVLNMEEAAAFCAIDGGFDLCDAIAEVPEGSILPEPDPRAYAGVSMAPCGWYTFGESGLGGVENVSLMVGSLDDTCEPDTEARPAWERVSDSKALATIPDAGHFVFSNLCDLGDLQPECSAEGYIDTPTAQVEIKHWATAWALRQYTGDAAYDEFLGSEVMTVE
ncbi:MAG: hypothetical protein FJ102_08540 [Deltaproteobacteria bacterium]|nr:hypothetical protein [Deltaproteobacteria bacterium]